MKIILFGISNVGKTTTGRLLAKRLGCAFHDIDEEIVRSFNMPIGKFVESNWPYERDEIRGRLIGDIVDYPGTRVIAAPPMYYSKFFNKYLKRDDVLAIELQDSVENIFNRLVFTDDDGNNLEDSVEYREEHKKYYMKEISKDITFYKRGYAKIENKFHMNNDPPEEVVDRIIRKYLRGDIICGCD